MIVYHGSYILIDSINLAKCKPNKDFGRGFYVTALRHQATIWAERLGKDHDTKGVITEFNFDETAFEDDELNTMRFEKYDDKWFDFVIANRNKSYQSNWHDYDIVEGPVADDAVSVRIDAYLDGLITKNDFLDELKFKRTTHQICFCTVRSLQYLNRTETTPDGIYYMIDDEIVKKLIASDGFSRQQATEVYFSSKTYKNFIHNYAKNKPWIEIYELLKEELKQSQK